MSSSSAADFSAASAAGQAAGGGEPISSFPGSIFEWENDGLETAYTSRCRIFGFHDISCVRARRRWWWRGWSRWRRGIGVRIGRVSVQQQWRGSGRGNTEQPRSPSYPAKYARHWRKRLGWSWPVPFRRRQRGEWVADRFAWLGQGVARESLVDGAMAGLRPGRPTQKHSGLGVESQHVVLRQTKSADGS